MKNTLWTRNFTIITLGTVISAIGALGEVMDYRLCLTAAHLVGMGLCYLILWRGREDVKPVYNQVY